MGTRLLHRSVVVEPFGVLAVLAEQREDGLSALLHVVQVHDPRRLSADHKSRHAHDIVRSWPPYTTRERHSRARCAVVLLLGARKGSINRVTNLYAHNVISRLGSDTSTSAHTHTCPACLSCIRCGGGAHLAPVPERVITDHLRHGGHAQ